MLATIFAYFWNFASLLHVSRRRLNDSDDQAGTHRSFSGQGSTQLPDRDTTADCSTYAEEQGDSGKPSALTFVHHIHREGVCFVWNVGEQEYYATREWEFITLYEQSLVDSFVFSLRQQSFIP